MSDFTQFITGNMYIVAAVLYVLGVFLKSIPNIPDWTIPFILTAIGIAFGAVSYTHLDVYKRQDVRILPCPVVLLSRSN